MFLEGCISFLIAVNIAILTNTVLIISLVNLRNRVENDCEKAIKEIKCDSEIDNRYSADLEEGIKFDLANIESKIKRIGVLSIINICLSFVIFLFIFLRFHHLKLWVDLLVAGLTLFSIGFFIIIIFIFIEIYNFDPKEKIRKWKANHRERIKSEKYNELTKMIKKLILNGSTNFSYSSKKR